MWSNKIKQKFPPSVQSDLFNYLRPVQQDFLKPILRVLKHRSQEDLCVALIDYLETGIPEPPYEPELLGIFRYIIHFEKPKGRLPEDGKFLYPLRKVRERKLSSTGRGEPSVSLPADPAGDNFRQFKF